MIGRTIAHYQIQELLAEGAMGIVYRARDLNLERSVAIKVLKPQRSSNEAAVERFMHEARAASSLDHPNVCTIYEIEKDESGQLFIVMAYYDGETLRRKLFRGPLSPEDALHYTIDIAQGLAKAHRQGLVHRDIKPENIIITADGIAKILDFGLVKLPRVVISGDPASEAIVGTVGYMSPEQIEGHADHRSDLWALGILFYEMLTGRRPFLGLPSVTVQGILHSEYTPASEVRPGISDGLDRVVSRALAKQPSERYQRAEEMIAHLHALRHGLASGLSKPENQVEGQSMTIAVLPFSNVGGGEEAEYFCDGLADELIHLLSQLKGLRVVSHTSAFEFKGKSQDIRAIAERLNVNTILEGSVRRAGDRLRVTVQLTDAIHGYHLWSQKYDHELKDIFAVQEGIARAVAAKFGKKPENEIPPLRSRYSQNIDAHALYLKGRYYWSLRLPEASRKGIQCFEQAIMVDPQCAPAYAGLADCIVSLGFFGAMPPGDAWARGRELAMKARELDPHLAEAAISLAKSALFSNWDWRLAEELAIRAIELDPGFSGSHFFYAILLLQSGRYESALHELRTARELDPLSSPISSGIAWVHYYEGHHALAIEQCEKVFAVDPEYPEAHACRGLALLALGRHAEAIPSLEHGVKVSGNNPIVIGFYGAGLACGGKAEEARAVLARLQDMAAKQFVSTVPPAVILIALGEYDAAMEYLEQAYRTREAFLAYARVFPLFDPVRQLPRFQALLGELDLASSAEMMTSELLASAK
ncbi:protein kinase domain-containing protein [Silvibacterium sp.]|uniref:protein kinase domain-containing protein n=1 Tax=Silvibacterium sp. TaxID=1964179 RepID=UPI0039E4A824